MTLPTVTVHSIGNEGEPVAVVENFAPDPEALRLDAAAKVFATGGDHYPGIRAALDVAYLKQQWGVLSPIFREVFGVTGNVAVLDVGYAMVTTPRAALTREQCLPHVDALAPGRLALIHYLVPGGTSGTAFYSHRSTRYETVSQTRSTAYFKQLNKDLIAHPLETDYPNQRSPLFEQTGHFEGIYNRALVYRGRLLHSGAISAEQFLSTDPTHGRLTITGFFGAA